MTDRPSEHCVFTERSTPLPSPGSDAIPEPSTSRRRKARGTRRSRRRIRSREPKRAPVKIAAMRPTRTAIGTWSGGRFMHFGEPLSEERLIDLLRPGRGIDTVLSADAYGAGAADELLGR